MSLLKVKCAHGPEVLPSKRLMRTFYGALSFSGFPKRLGYSVEPRKEWNGRVPLERDSVSFLEG